MKHLIVLLLLSSCAYLPKWESNWEFDCEWARQYDWRNQMQAQSSGFPIYSNMTAIYCPNSIDPTAPWNLTAKKKELPEEAPSSH